MIQIPLVCLLLKLVLYQYIILSYKSEKVKYTNTKLTKDTDMVCMCVHVYVFPFLITYSLIYPSDLSTVLELGTSKSQFLSFTAKSSRKQSHKSQKCSAVSEMLWEKSAQGTVVPRVQRREWLFGSAVCGSRKEGVIRGGET